MSDLPFDRAAFSRELEAELRQNILPFWLEHAVDPVRGGFHGAVTNDLQVHDEEPRAVILCARILWSYAAAYHRWPEERYLALARHAFETLTQIFWDDQYGGLYWLVDRDGEPVADRKQHYAQAFGIYGLSEYYRASNDPQSLALAQQLFQLLEHRAYEPLYGGYWEASDRRWQPLADVRLSYRDLNAPKSMNTMLHILEGYTNLLRVWDDGQLRAQHRALIKIFLEQIVDLDSGHLHLFFDETWRSLSDHVSFGHDVETSWLLWEAVELHDDSMLAGRVREAALALAYAVYKRGLDDDGSLFYQARPEGLVDANKAWWPQVEGMVGFYNAYQLGGGIQLAAAAHHLWTYSQDHLIDQECGDWFKQLDRAGSPDLAAYKIGPWHGPYHHSRACMEMLDRLQT